MDEKTPSNDSISDGLIYTLSVNLQVLKHLGIGLYSNLPSVVSEMVANAYDADATEVDITIKGDTIVIKDNGLGMNVEDANKKFLTVGYDKRVKEKNAEGKVLTAKFGRLPMGRKGIGKLSTFAIANTVRVESVKICLEKDSNGKITQETICGSCAFQMDVKAIEERAKKKEKYNPEKLDNDKLDFTRGTRITLTNLKRERGINAEFVRRNLARRFAVFGKNFKVSINESEVSINDRQYWDKLQFVWGLGPNPEFDMAKGGGKVKNADAIANSEGENNEVLSNEVSIPGDGVEFVTGWIGTVHLPKDLKDENLDNNGIVVMARGKLVHENLLPFARTGRVFAEYIVGEINADWLDTDNQDDIAASDRQNLRENDVRFNALQSYLKERLNEIAQFWDKWRKAVGKKEAIERHPALKEWLDTLNPDNRKQAEKLIASIEGMAVSDNESKKELFKHGIMAFETLALKGNLEAFSKFATISGEDFKVILDAMSELDAAHYYQIAKNRWAVLKEFQKLVNDDEKEKLIQEKIFQNTWLMDASWERPTEDVEMEKRFAKKLESEKLGFDKNEKLSRYDIKYLTVSGKDLLIELKKSGRKVTYEELLKQVRKYDKIMQALAYDVDPAQTPNFEIIVLLGVLPSGFGKAEIEALKPFNARVMTYNFLIKHAEKSYKEYLDAQEKVAKIQTLIDKL
jgi:Histidine kinase-, DNA gyrase B-, and HSP90-like ATPase